MPSNADRTPPAAQDQREAVIAAARLAVATYPIPPSVQEMRTDADFYMAKLRDALEALDATE